MQQNEPTAHLFVAYQCKECGFEGDVEIINKTVTCPTCGTVNDVWQDGETPPPNHRNEPTTDEIVRALRYCADVNSICGDACPAHLDEAGCRTVLMKNAADLLEGYKRVVVDKDRTIAELAARAESAERERDAAKAYMKRFGCLTCEGQGTIGLNEPCWGCRDKSNWKMRGLPQEGDVE